MLSVQEQPPEMFFRKSCSSKFLNIPRKTPVLESLFKKVSSVYGFSFSKKWLQHRCFTVNITSNPEQLFWRISAKGCFCLLHSTILRSEWSTVFGKTSVELVLLLEFEMVNLHFMKILPQRFIYFSDRLTSRPLTKENSF